MTLSAHGNYETRCPCRRLAPWVFMACLIGPFAIVLSVLARDFEFQKWMGVNPDAWLSGTLSFAGAGLTAAVALVILGLQSAKQDRQTRQDREHQLQVESYNLQVGHLAALSETYAEATSHYPVYREKKLLHAKLKELYLDYNRTLDGLPDNYKELINDKQADILESSKELPDRYRESRRELEAAVVRNGTLARAIKVKMLLWNNFANKEQASSTRMAQQISEALACMGGDIDDEAYRSIQELMETFFTLFSALGASSMDCRNGIRQAAVDEMMLIYNERFSQVVYDIKAHQASQDGLKDGHEAPENEAPVS